MLTAWTYVQCAKMYFFFLWTAAFDAGFFILEHFRR